MLFVGRQGPAAQLGQWLRKDEAFDPKNPLKIGSIYGPGGIGKTFLVDYCLHHTQGVDLSSFVRIRVDGRKDIKSLEALLCEELPMSTSLPLESIPNVFRGLINCRDAVQTILQSAKLKLKRDYADSPILFQRLDYLLSFGLNPTRALAQQPYDLALLEMSEDELEQAIELLLHLPVFRPEFEWISRWKKAKVGRRLRNELRRDSGEVLAGECLSDLERLFSTKQVTGKRLLWIFDDYESLDMLAGDFLVSQIIERLKVASFPSLLLFVGRDNLLATHTAWGQHHRNLVGERLIELKPFKHQEAMELMRKRGLYDSEICERIWEETQGFPFLLDLECEDAVSGGRSALGLKLFFDRLTRWMTPIQREWITPLSFLDEVNLETVSSMLPSHNAEAILDWFKREPAIRDPHASIWQVLPFVRHRIQQYVKNDSPQTFDSLNKKGQQVAKSFQNKV